MRMCEGVRKPFPVLKVLAGVVAVVIVTIAVVLKMQPLLVLPLLVSVVVGFLQSKVNRYCFLIGAVNSVFYAVAYYMMTLYATAAYALLVSFPLQIVTFLMWNKKTVNNRTQTRKMTARVRAILAVSMVLMWGMLYLIFHSFGSEYLVFDNTITVIGIVSTVVASLRFAEFAAIQVASSSINSVSYAIMAIGDPTKVVWLVFSIYSATCSAVAFFKMNKREGKMQTIKPKTEHGIVNRATDTVFCYQAWPTVARDENGTLYVVASGCRAGHICPFGKTVMYKSYDGGNTWTNATVINDTCLDDRDAGILYMGNGRMLVTWFTHSAYEYSTRYREQIAAFVPDGVRSEALGVIDGYSRLPEKEKLAGSYIRISEDYGATWSEKIALPVSAPHGPGVCADGTLVYLGSVQYESDRIHLRKDVKNALYKSFDGGYTWEHVSDIQPPKWLRPNEFLCEDHIIELERGVLLASFRVEGGKPLRIATAVSRDGGKTWGSVKCTDALGAPPHLLKHSSGALICSFGRRELPYGVRAMLSRDGGESWSEEYILDERAKLWDFGYPSTVELDDGSLLTVYYQRYDDDAHCSILYTKWNPEQ